MVLEDGKTEIWYEAEDTPEQHLGKGSKHKGGSADMEEADETGPIPASGLEKLDEEAEHQQVESEPPTDLDESLKAAAIPKETKAVLQKNLSDWNSKFD